MTDIPPPPPSALPPPPPPNSSKWYSKKAGPLPVWAWIATAFVVLGAIGALTEEPAEDTSADVARDDAESKKEAVEAEVPEEQKRQSVEPDEEAPGARCERDNGSVASEGSTWGQGADRVRCEDGAWVAYPTSDPVYTTTTRPESTLSVGADDVEETDDSPVATTTAAPTETIPPPTTSPPTTAPPATSAETSAQRDAVDTARSYLRFMSFSRQGLIEQLEYEGFTTSDATYGVDAQNADWFEQAVLTAENYLDVMSFSRSGLIDQLIYEGFTSAEATHGADTAFASADASGGGETASQANARESAASYLSFMAFSRTGLIDQLEYEGYSTADATYGVDAQNADWNQQAALKAEEYLDFMSFTRSELIDQLLYEGFTQSEATYGVNQVGL